MIGINDKGGTDRGSVVFVHAHPDDEATIRAKMAEYMVEAKRQIMKEA